MVLLGRWHEGASAHPTAFAWQDPVSYTVDKIPMQVGNVNLPDVYSLIDQSKATIRLAKAKLAELREEAQGRAPARGRPPATSALQLEGPAVRRPLGAAASAFLGRAVGE
uniref:Uncharacterized protein n=1 Tax=Alexandrium monilatum TaxID=311494 RepID=A0A7S4VBT8_9DINO|mmetsp:Transcript_39262/g.117351  ORF Transcript_39262/g.117351 Transcript_39262/m.117351 type:complete len:110 (+) Transcript_39262:48-377(+)